MNLREQMVKYCRGKSVAERLTNADSILALPSGLVAKKECTVCNGYVTPRIDCSACNGYGFITRDVAVGEAIEILKEYVEEIPQMTDDTHILYLVTKSGEHIEVSHER